MDQPPIIFVSGLPRSGSTLLMNLFGQNPAHHVTPTNGLLELLVGVRDKWSDLLEFRAQGVATVQPRIESTMRAMVDGFYVGEFKEGKTVFDKCRGWLAYIEMMEEVLRRPITILVTVRDIRAIITSFEKLNLRHPLTAPRPANYWAGQTVEGRIAVMLNEAGVVGLAVNRLRDALRRPHKSRILMVPYNQLCRNTVAVLAHLHEELDLPPFTYDPNNVSQITFEDDSVYGVPLHNVRSKVELSEESPWEGVLPKSVCDKLVSDFADIQTYAETE